jgi:hypothetical protein
MDLPTARQSITDALERMRRAYYRPVFDEWAILAVGANHGGVVAYSGFRAAQFLENFQADIAPLRETLAGTRLEPGDFEFVADARDTRHDAALKVGASSFLILNNTTKRMAEIRADPRWLHAQAVFVELAELFRNDPLESV